MASPVIEDIDFLLLPSSTRSTIAICRSALHKGVRVDGRSIKEFRNIDIELLRKPGHAIVSFGNTKVFVAISAEVVAPNLERPNEGVISFNLEMSPMCSKSYEPNRQTDTEKKMCHTIEKVFKDSGAVDVESLCISAGKYVWCIRVKLRVVQDDGNVLDVCSVAALVGLGCFKKPETIATNEHIQSVKVDSSYLSPLKLYHTPILVSIGILRNSEINIVDTSRFEANVVETYVTLLFNQFGDLFFIQKNGGLGIPLQRINEVIALGKNTAINMHEAIAAQMRRFSNMDANKVKFRLRHYSSPTVDVMAAL